jgi:hypothetical protein
MRVPISLNREVNGSQQHNGKLFTIRWREIKKHFALLEDFKVSVGAFLHLVIILVNWTIWISRNSYVFNQVQLTHSKLQKLLIGRAKQKYFPKITE